MRFPRLFSVQIAGGSALAGLLGSALLAGCAQYATVRERRPTLPLARTTLGALVSVEQAFTTAAKHQQRNPLLALGHYLDAASAASQQLAKNPNDTAARDAYNFAVARIFTAMGKGHFEPWTRPLHVPATGGEYVLTHRGDPQKRKYWNPALYDFTPADEFDVHGTYVKERTVKPGVGAPLVALGRETRTDAAEQFVADKTYYGVTAIAYFEGRKVKIELADPLATEMVSLNGRSCPLAADFTVPVAVMLARENPKKLELVRALNPEKYAKTAQIIRLQPYDPDKTVVLVVHGLIDSPATWTPMLNTLRGDPAIRQNYQFWYYSYPSGYAFPYSAAIMRRELNAIEQRFPLRKKMILVGHSMGGCISRLMITDSGDKLWLTTFGKPPEQTNLSATSRAKLEDALIFRHRHEVGRVIFISAPLRGSQMALGGIGRFAARLIKAPVTLLEVGNDMRKAMVADTSALHLKRIPNSVDTLAPNNRFVKAINTIPITWGIPYHVISGDRGKGGNKDKTPPVMSDGVVPYWSSHLDGAQSELVVPSHHSAHQNSQAIAEVRRILREHAGVSTQANR